MQVFILVFFQVFFFLPAFAGDGSTDELSKQIVLLSKIKGCGRAPNICQPAPIATEDSCPNYLSLFDISGDSQFKDKVRDVIINLSKIEIGKSLFDKLKGKVIKVQSGEESSHLDELITFSFDQIESSLTFEKDKKKRIKESDIQVDCAFFHELVHFYYKKERRNSFATVKNSLYHNPEELATISGDIGIYCVMGNDETCKKKIYEFNENECRRQMGLNPRYGHVGAKKNNTKKDDFNFDLYFLGCSPFNHEDISKKINDPVEKKIILNKLANSSGTTIKKYKNEFKMSDEDVLEICSIATSDNKVWEKQTGYFFLKLLENVSDKNTSRKCLANFTDKKILNLLQDKKDHHLLREPIFLSIIRSDPKLYDKILRSSAQVGFYDLLNIVLDSEEGIKKFIRDSRNWEVGSNDYFRGDPCILQKKISPLLLKEPSLLIGRNEFLSHFFYLSHICKSNDIPELVFEDKKNQLTLDERLKIICAIPPSLFDKSLATYSKDFYKSNEAYLNNAILNKDKPKDKCFPFLKKVNEHVIVPLSYIVDSISLKKGNKDFYKSTFNNLDLQGRENLKTQVTNKIKDYFISIKDEKELPYDGIVITLRNLLKLDELIGKEESILSCDLLSSIPSSISKMSTYRSSSPNYGGLLINRIIEKKIKCSDKSLPDKIFQLCTKLGDESPCPYPMIEIQEALL